jgi:hypothetical protein
MEGLPACLGYAGQLTAVCKLAEADAAEIEVAHVAVLAAAAPTATNDTRGKLRRTFRFGDLRFGCHRLVFERKAKSGEERAALFTVLRGG